MRDSLVTLLLSLSFSLSFSPRISLSSHSVLLSAWLWKIMTKNYYLLQRPGIRIAYEWNQLLFWYAKLFCLCSKVLKMYVCISENIKIWTTILFEYNILQSYLLYFLIPNSVTQNEFNRKILIFLVKRLFTLTSDTYRKSIWNYFPFFDDSKRDYNNT